MYWKNSEGERIFYVLNQNRFNTTLLFSCEACLLKKKKCKRTKNNLDKSV